MRTLYRVRFVGGFVAYTPADDYDHAVLRAAELSVQYRLDWTTVAATSVRA